MIIRNVEIFQLVDILVLEYGILLRKTVNTKLKFRDLQRPCQTADPVGGKGARNFHNIVNCLKTELKNQRSEVTCYFPIEKDVLCSAEKKLCPGRLLRVFMSSTESHQGNYICRL